MKLYLPITVDLYNIYPLPIMNVQQHNIGRGALVTLTAAGQVVMPNKESLYVYTKKRDGTIVYAACTLSGNQIKIDYNEQMTAIAGTMTVELQMADGNGNSITTPIFQVNIQPSNIDYKKITSSDEFLALVDALKNVNSFQGQINELNEKIIPLEFNVPEGSDIDTEKYRKFGFYSGKGLVNAPTNAWFQWLTFPLNGNLKYPAQIGFWVDNHSGDVRMYTRALSDVSGTHVWKNWVEIATNEKFKIIESAEIAFNTSTTINYTLYSLPAPSGYKVVSREFIRLDDGAYNVLVSLLQNRDYIVHMGASERTVRGKVMALCIKTN